MEEMLRIPLEYPKSKITTTKYGENEVFILILGENYEK